MFGDLGKWSDPKMFCRLYKNVWYKTLKNYDNLYEKAIRIICKFYWYVDRKRFKAFYSQIYLNYSARCSISQWHSIIWDSGGGVVLKVVTREIRLDLFLILYFKVTSLDAEMATFYTYAYWCRRARAQKQNMHRW